MGAESPPTIGRRSASCVVTHLRYSQSKPPSFSMIGPALPSSHPPSWLGFCVRSSGEPGSGPGATHQNSSGGSVSASLDRISSSDMKGDALIALEILVIALTLIAAMAPVVRGEEDPPPSPERLRQMAEMVNRPVVYKVPGMDQVKVRK